MLKLAVLVAGAVTAAGAQAYEFQGVEVGGPSTYDEAQLQAALAARGFGSGLAGLRWFGCEPMDAGRQHCRGLTSISALMLEAQALLSPGGIVEQVSLRFRPREFPTIESWALATYGQPSDTLREPFPGGPGRSATNVDHLWLAADGRFIRLTRYAGRASESRLHFGVAPRAPDSTAEPRAGREAAPDVGSAVDAPGPRP